MFDPCSKTQMDLLSYSSSGLPLSRENVWKMKKFPGQRKVREFLFHSGKFRKNVKSQGIAEIVIEFCVDENGC